jgi:hypothetical protein
MQIKSVNDQNHFHGVLRTLHASRGAGGSVIVFNVIHIACSRSDI